MNYIKTKRDLIGPCNLCKENATLSWDHVPPQGGIDPAPVQVQSFFDILRTSTRLRPRYCNSPNGLKFRTICKKCNSFLGTHYDPVINRFYRDVHSIVATKIVLPEVVSIKTKPFPLIKGLIGHLISSRIDYQDSAHEELLRNFVLDIDSNQGICTTIFYFIYPFEKTIVIRDFVMPKVRGNFQDVSFFDLMKSFPIGFLFSDSEYYEGLYKFNAYLPKNVSDEAEIPVNLKFTHHEFWPEAPDDGNFLLGGEDFVHSVLARRR